MFMVNSILEKYGHIGQQVPSLEEFRRARYLGLNLDIDDSRIDESSRIISPPDLERFEAEDMQFSRQLREASELAADL